MGIGITSFLEDCRSRGLTKHTIDTYRSNVSAYLDFVGDPLKVDTPQLQNFLNYLREDMVYAMGKTRKKRVSPRTLSAYFSTISSYYYYFIYEGTLKNPHTSLQEAIPDQQQAQDQPREHPAAHQHL